MTVEIEGFSVLPMTFDGVRRDVYRRGTGPGVIVMHEVPGITPDVARFARRVADAGFTVFVPSLFGKPNQSPTPGYVAIQLARACVNREFRAFAANETSPIVSWLRALCAAAHAELGGLGVGAIGMCITGNFALGLMVEPSMMAPVLSQPSLPIGASRAARRGLHLSPDDLVQVRRRAADGVPVLALRFTGDPMCPAARFQRLRDELGDSFEAIEIDSRPGNSHGITPVAHSVLTHHLVDEAGHPTRAALERVLSFFAEHLQP